MSIPSVSSHFQPFSPAIGGFQADLACRRISWSTLTRFAKVNSMANWLSFFIQAFVAGF
ncbi:hypothetical protein VCCP104619_3946, partial [Vibrio cholerae CP1046(19)]